MMMVLYHLQHHTLHCHYRTLQTSRLMCCYCHPRRIWGNEMEVFHFENELDIHMTSRNHDDNEYGHELNTLIILH